MVVISASMKPRRRHGRWEARWWDPNAGRERSRAGFETRAAADRYSTEMQARLNRGELDDPRARRTTLAAWWDAYLERHTAHLRPGTLATYKGAMRCHVLPHLGGRRLASLRRSDLDSWAAKLRAEGRSSDVIHQAYRVLRRALQVAEDSELIVKNPARGLKLKITDSDPRDRRVLSAVELAAVAAVIEPRYRALVLTMGWCGLRIGEAAALRLEHLDLLHREIEVVEAVRIVNGRPVLGRTKTAQTRVVTIPAPLVPELERHLEHFPPRRGLVFGGERGGYLNHHNLRARQWLPALRDAGISELWPRLHDLRHTAASLARASGADMKEIMERLGHSSIALTIDTYTHLFGGADHALADKLGALWPDLLPPSRAPVGPTKPVGL
jgi:integrase